MKYYVLLLSFLIPCSYLQGSQSPIKCMRATPMVFHKKQTVMPQYQSIAEQIKPRLKKINHSLDARFLELLEYQQFRSLQHLLSGNQIPDVNVKTTQWSVPNLLYVLYHIPNESKISLEIVKSLVNAGIAVNARSADGWTALMRAAAMGNTETVKILIDSGANLNAQTINGWTALILAAENHHIPIMKLLLDAGAYPISASALSEVTAERYGEKWAKEADEVKKFINDYESQRAKYHQGVVAPIITESIQEAYIPKEVSGVIAGYADVKLPQEK